MNLEFVVLEARSEPHAASPTIVFRLRISESSGAYVHTAILRCRVRIDPRLRRYSESEAGSLVELFGEPARWNDTMRPLQWAETPVVVPSFDSSVDLDVPISCTYDFEVASAKYFHGVESGDIPLTFLFTGTVFVATADGYEALPVPWDREALFRLRADMWHEAVAQHFHDSAWIRLSRSAFDALYRLRTSRALPSWDETVETLCQEVAKRGAV